MKLLQVRSHLFVFMLFFLCQYTCFAQLLTTPYNKASDAPVLIVFGQSNAQGYTQPLTGADTARIGVHLQNVHGLSRANNLSLTSTNVVWDGYCVGDTNNNPANLYNLGDSNPAATYNVAGEFAQLWQNAINSGTSLPDLYVIHIAWPNQGILSGDTNGTGNLWYPGLPSYNQNSLYPFANRILALAMQNLINSGKRPIIVGMHWDQWEADNQNGLMQGSADVANKYTSFFNGFQNTLGGAVFPIMLYEPRSTLYTRNNWGGNPQHFNDIVNGFNSLNARNPSIYQIIDAAQSTDINGTSYYNPNTSDFTYGIFNSSDTVHYLGKVHQWFARKQWAKIFTSNIYGGIVNKVNMPAMSTMSISPKHFGQKIDFNGDGKSDLLFTNGTTSNVIWEMSGLNLLSGQFITSTTSSTAWQPLAKGDFDGDGKTDILWFNSVTGQYVIWFMNGFTVLSGPVMTPPAAGWSLVGTGDFDGDGKTDLLWYNPSTNQYVIWFMNGATPRSDSGLIPTPAGGWNFEAIGDFNGDHKSDIVWNNPTTGQYVIWNMNGLTKIGDGLLQQPGAGWSIQAVGDIDGDGIADILWFNSATNQYVIWYMNGGLGTKSNGLIQQPGPGWSFLDTGDYDGDGRTDILWFNSSSGQYVIWFMNGGYTPSSASGLITPTPSSPWAVVP